MTDLQKNLKGVRDKLFEEIWPPNSKKLNQLNPTQNLFELPSPGLSQSQSLEITLSPRKIFTTKKTQPLDPLSILQHLKRQTRKTYRYRTKPSYTQSQVHKQVQDYEQQAQLKGELTPSEQYILNGCYNMIIKKQLKDHLQKCRKDNANLISKTGEKIKSQKLDAINRELRLAKRIYDIEIKKEKYCILINMEEKGKFRQLLKILQKVKSIQLTNDIAILGEIQKVLLAFREVYVHPGSN